MTLTWVCLSTYDQRITEREFYAGLLVDLDTLTILACL